MAYGDTPHDAILKKAWDDFCDRLKEAGDVVFRDPAPPMPLDRAEGFRYLSRTIGRGLNVALEYTDPLSPGLRLHNYPLQKYGGDNPDSLRLRARLDGEHTYRIVGHRGTVSWVVFSINKRHPTIPWQYQETARLLGRDLRTEWDGSFQLILSPQPHPGNWLKTGPDTYQINIRQFFLDWVAEKPMTIRIELMDGAGPPAPVTPKRMAEGLRGAADLVVRNTAFYVDFHQPFRTRPNMFVGRDAAALPDMGGNPAGITAGLYWRVQPDEVLVIECMPPHCAYWNMELNNFWMCSSDYRYHLSSINMAQAVPEEDRSVRIAIAHQDPGIPNWLDTAGHCEGWLGSRWILADRAPVLETRLVKLADLPSLLPPNVRRTTPEERREHLRRRKIGVDRRFRV